MRTLPPPKAMFIAVLSAGILLCGCHGNQAATNSATQADQASNDPATANLAPVADTNAPPANGPAYSGGAAYPPSSNPPDEYDGEYSDQGEDTADESYYGVAPDATAPDPPPPLPEYDQPPCPGDGYEWTPGYWDYASTGYYWVPGVWVQAPYVDALWTPGYWGYSRGHYAFFHGYWGPHIGFYGGINYGFGYTGVGYQGGYWNNGQFDYNRSVNNVNVTVIHNVYSRTIVVNRTTIINNTRVSYNGGSGGIQVRPQPAELAALREPHAAPMQTQVQVQRSASENRAQFAALNNGRPVQVADNRPVAAVANVRPASPTQIRNLPIAARPPMAARNNTVPTVPANRPPENNSQPNRPQPTPQQPGRPEMNAPQGNRPEPQNQPVHPQPTQAGRPAPNYAQPNRAQPEPQAARPAQNRPASPQPRPEEQPSRPAPQPRPQAQPSRQLSPQPSRPPAQSHPAPEPSHPAPEANHAAPRQNRPAPQEHTAPPKEPPQEKRDERPPQ